MRTFGNIVWFLSGGWVLFLIYAFAAVVCFPFFLPLWRLARHAAWPWGTDLVTEGELQAYRRATGKADPSGTVGKIARHSGTVLNVLWLLTFGWFLAGMHIFIALEGAAFLLFSLVGIPLAVPHIMGHLRLVGPALMPFNRHVVSAELAAEIRAMVKKGDLGIA